MIGTKFPLFRTLVKDENFERLARSARISLPRRIPRFPAAVHRVSPSGKTNLGLSRTHMHKPLEAVRKKERTRAYARASGLRIAPSSRDVLYDGDNIAKIDFS